MKFVLGIVLLSVLAAPSFAEPIHEGGNIEIELRTEAPGGADVTDQLKIHLDCYRAIESYHRVWSVRNLSDTANPSLLVPSESGKEFYLYTQSGAYSFLMPGGPIPENGFALKLQLPAEKRNFFVEYGAKVIRVYPESVSSGLNGFAEMTGVPAANAIGRLADYLKEQLGIKRSRRALPSGHPRIPVPSSAVQSRLRARQLGYWQSCARSSDAGLRAESVQALAELSGSP